MQAHEVVKLAVGDEGGAVAELWLDRAASRAAGGRRGPGPPALLLAHGAGGDVDEATLAAIAAGARRARAEGGLDLDVVRLRFPYRVAGRKVPDPATRCEAAFRAATAFARRELSAGRVFAGGRSMGGRVASLAAVAGEPVDGLLFLAYPLHAAGAADDPDGRRDAHLYVIQRPMLFVSGDRDPLARTDLLGATVERLGRARAALHVVAGGDHGFKTLKRSGRTTDDAQAEVVRTSLAWLRGLL